MADEIPPVENAIEDKGEHFVEEIKSESERLKAYIAELSPRELFAHIEGNLKTLLKMIEAIPDGVTHGYHSLAGEIRARL